MPYLMKIGTDDIYIAENFVHAPGYSLIVANMTVDSPVTDGWKYFDDNRTRESFPPIWSQPTGAHDAYAKGFQVFYAGKIWESTILGNVWQPGISGWREVTTEDTDVPAWIQPTGAHDAYVKEAIVSHATKLWKSTADANVWAPGVYGWELYSTLLPTISSYPNWVQPTGSHDSYAIDAIVVYNGQNWKSTVGTNVWIPGVYGWVVI